VQSPYELALGTSFTELHPRLRTYFSAIPPEMEGYGEGVFSVVGTPHRWLWPVLWMLGRQGVLFPGWHQDVPFVVLNEPAVDEHGNTSVNAHRTFRFAHGSRTMVDAIAFDGHTLIDQLGTARRYVATFVSRIEAGALTLQSSTFAIRAGKRRITVPRLIATRVSLTERFDEADGRQHVTVTVTAPVIGQLYVYTGSFEYRLRCAGTKEQL